jgi:endonuclease YncB( thermonuclease family)
MYVSQQNRRRRERLVAWACALVVASGVHRTRAADADAPTACASIEGAAGKVVKIASPLALQLDSGIVVQLSEISAPAASPDAPGTDVAGAALARLALGNSVQLFFDGAKQDRHGRALAQVFVIGADEPSDQGRNRLWLQRALVEQGAAYVDTWPTNRTCAADLLAAETVARTAGKGLWSDPANRVLSVDDAAQGEGRFALVEGRIVSAAKAGKPQRIYLDFGPDWHTDFTIAIPPAAARLFNKAGIDPLSLKGATVRVRGYVGWNWGPEIEADNPEVIEVLSRPTPGAASPPGTRGVSASSHGRGG